MDNLPIPLDSPIHPLAASRTHLLVVLFAQSRSPNIKAALNLAQQANEYCQIDIDGSPFHIASFAKNPKQADLALGLLHLATSWKGTHVFIGGRASHDAWRIQQVLECFQKSTRCTDHTAHCHVIKNDLIVQTKKQESGVFASLFGSNFASSPQTEWIHPCRLVGQYYESRLDPRHSASLIDQLQAQAIRHECEWCPNFNAAGLRRL